MNALNPRFALEGNVLRDMVQAAEAIADMIKRSKDAQAKFREGTAQYTLQVNRIKALEVAQALIHERLGESDPLPFVQDQLEDAIVPLRSLLSKSEKVLTKLKEGTWQYNMLEKNIAALHTALPLVQDAISYSSSDSGSKDTP